MPDRRDDLAFALHLADHAESMAMSVFTGGDLDHEVKPDGSPVTDTDRAIEAALRELVAGERPDDGFLGEELPQTRGGGPRRWIVDPIDGTKNFIRGKTGWAIQIALEEEDELVVGVSAWPALKGRWWGAVGTGATGRRSADDERALAVSTIDALEVARWSSNPTPDRLAGEQLRWAERLEGVGSFLGASAWTTHPALLVAEGELDVCLQIEGCPWDHAALVAIVVAAGGRAAQLDGSPTLPANGPMLYANGSLLEAALARY